MSIYVSLLLTLPPRSMSPHNGHIYVCMYVYMCTEKRWKQKSEGTGGGGGKGGFVSARGLIFINRPNTMLNQKSSAGR